MTDHARRHADMARSMSTNEHIRYTLRLEDHLADLDALPPELTYAVFRSGNPARWIADARGHDGAVAATASADTVADALVALAAQLSKASASSTTDSRETTSNS